jgi:hypothetical protein
LLQRTDFLEAADDHRAVPTYAAEERDMVSGSCDDVRPAHELADTTVAHPRHRLALDASWWSVGAWACRKIGPPQSSLQTEIGPIRPAT